MTVRRIVPKQFVAALLGLVVGPFAAMEGATVAREAAAAWYPHVLTASPARRIPGPFRCSSLTFFLVHHGGDLSVEFRVDRESAELKNNGGIHTPHTVFWQFHGPDGKVIRKEYAKFTDDGKTIMDWLAQFPDDTRFTPIAEALRRHGAGS